MQSRTGPFDVVSRAIAYLLGGIFIYGANATGPTAWVGHIFGVVFICFAFFVLISSFFNRLGAWTDAIHGWFMGALFIGTVARLIVTAVGSKSVVQIVLAFAFLLLVTGVLFFQSLRHWAGFARTFGNRVALTRILRALSVVFGLFALAMVTEKVDALGGPVLYLALGLVCLGIASLP